MFNLSLSIGMVPDKLKIVTVIPVLKAVLKIMFQINALSQ